MWWFDATELQASAYPEARVQRGAKEYARLLGGFVVDLSQGRETQQTEGLVDVVVIHPEWHCTVWVEVKQPEIRAPGVRPGTTRIIQQRGKWRWQQEEFHRVLQAAQARVVTIDHPEELCAYLAWCGYPVDPNLYRRPFDPAAQERFRDPKAYQRWVAEKLRQRENRRTRKLGPRLQSPLALASRLPSPPSSEATANAPTSPSTP